MKRFLRILFLTCFLLYTPSLFASHAAAGEISYRLLSATELEVSISLYTDCSAPAQQATDSLEIFYVSGTCMDSGSAYIHLLPGSETEINPGPYLPCGINSCNGGTAYGLKKVIYIGILQLASPCSDWKIYCDFANRNPLVTTLVSPNNYSIYLEANVNNMLQSVNASPTASIPPVYKCCTGRLFDMSHNYQDADGDSLVYSLIAPRGRSGPGNPVQALSFVNPYTAQQFYSSASGIIFDALTGTASGIPVELQGVAAALLITEYRNGQLIGSVMRDIQILIEARCTILPSLSESAMDSVTCSSTEISIRLNEPVTCNSVAADASDFLLYDPAGQIIPLLSAVPQNCSGDYTDRILLTSAAPLQLNGNYKLVSATGSDGNTLLNRCSYAMAAGDSLFISIADCFTGSIHLKYVSYSIDESFIEVEWEIPDGIHAGNFNRYTLYKRSGVLEPFILVDSISQWNQTNYQDLLISAPDHLWEYAIQIHTLNAYSSPLSNTLSNIHLQCMDDPAEETFHLSWSPYAGWEKAEYILTQSDASDQKVQFFAGPDSGFEYTGTLPPLPGEYRYRAASSHPTDANKVSLSNSCRLKVEKRELKVPNVFTPNGDGKNDYFEIKNLIQYPNARLIIFDRWGKKVFESPDYQNDWKGDDVEEGNYFYILIVPALAPNQFRGTLTLLRQ